MKTTVFFLFSPIVSIFAGGNRVCYQLEMTGVSGSGKVLQITVIRYQFLLLSHLPRVAFPACEISCKIHVCLAS